MFKRKLLSVLVATAVVGFGGYAMNASADVVTGTANATILTPLSITESVQMNFGTIAPSAAGGDVVMNTSGVRTAVTGFVYSGTPFAGSFAVVGSGVLTYAITLPANGVVTLTDNGGNGGAAMPVKDFVSLPSGTGTLTAGAQTLLVGATLTIGVDQVASTYDGGYDVTVNYN